MNILQKLTAKPWLADSNASGTAHYNHTPIPAAKLALRLFLAVVTVLFLLSIITYFSRSQYPDWQPLTGETWSPLANLWPLWLNTALLLISSLALETARFCARKNKPRKALISFMLGGLFAIAFLMGQLWVWQQFMSWGYTVAANPATSFFYLLTGLHGAHLLGGLVAWGITSTRVLRDKGITRHRLSLELCATYWHYLLAIWLLLFALLASPPETYEAIAAFCGFR